MHIIENWEWCWYQQCLLRSYIQGILVPPIRNNRHDKSHGLYVLSEFMNNLFTLLYSMYDNKGKMSIPLAHSSLIH